MNGAALFGGCTFEIDCLFWKGTTHMTKTINRIRNWIIGIMMAVLILLAIALTGVRLFGLHPYVVLSGSMEPTYHAGSLIYVKTVDDKRLQVGDPITYMVSQDTVVTHRIVEVIPDPEDPDVLRYRTKGDANSAADSNMVHFQNVIGRPVFSIPFLGYVSDYIQNPPGKYAAIGVSILLILLVFLPDIGTGTRKKHKRKKGKYEK